MEEYRGGGGIESGDNLPLLVAAGITARYEHHRGCRARIRVERNVAQRAFGGCLEQRHEVGGDAQHDYLGLRVTHAYVVFNHHRLALHVDEAEEDESAVVDAAVQKAVDGGTHNAFLDLGHESFVGKRHGAYCTHAAGIEAGVALAHALVVFRHGEDAVASVAVGEHKYRAFNSLEKFLDYDRSARCSEHAVEHCLQLGLCLVERVEYQHAFSGGKAVGLKHIWRIERFQEGVAVVERLAGERAVAGRRDSEFSHEQLGEILAPFEHGSGLFRTDYKQRGEAVAEIVGYTGHEGIFVADHKEVDGIGFHEFLDCDEIEWRNGHIDAEIACAAVAGGDE